MTSPTLTRALAIVSLAVAALLFTGLGPSARAAELPNIVRCDSGGTCQTHPQLCSARAAVLTGGWPFERRYQPVEQYGHYDSATTPAAIRSNPTRPGSHATTAMMTRPAQARIETGRLR